MKLEVHRRGFKIVPDGPIDEAFIEEVLGLKERGAYCKLSRVNVMGLNALAYVETVEVDRSPRAWTPSTLEEAIASNSNPGAVDELLANSVRRLRPLILHENLADTAFSVETLQERLKKRIEDKDWLEVAALALKLHDTAQQP